MIQGSLVPNITFFDEHGTIDEKKTTWHMDWMFQRGLDGLFLTGSYGAGPMMTVEERVRVYELAAAVTKNYPGKTLLPHVGALRTSDAVALAKAAEKNGAAAIGAVPPFYYKFTDSDVKEYYRALINAVSIPVFAYNNPATSRFTFSVALVRELIDMGLAGLKDSPLNVGFLSRLAYETKHAGTPFQIILGTSTGWLPFWHMGVRAAIAGMNNWAPEIITEMVRATVAGEMDRAEQAYLVMSDLSAKMHFMDSTIVSHVGLYTRGYDAGFPRAPMQLPKKDDPAFEKVRQTIAGGFEALGLEMKNG